MLGTVKLIAIILIIIIIIYIVIRVFFKNKTVITRINKAIDALANHATDKVVEHIERIGKEKIGSPALKTIKEVDTSDTLDDLFTPNIPSTLVPSTLPTPLPPFSPKEIDLQDKDGIFRFSDSIIKQLKLYNGTIQLSNRSESRSLGEHICRNIFEKRFNRKFISVRPKHLLTTPSGGVCEFDGFCDDMNIAFEFNGIQHYKQVSAFPGHVLEIQQWNDDFKTKQCRKNGVILIVINGSNTKKYNEIKISLEKLLRGEIIEDQYVDIVANRNMFKQLLKHL